MGLILAENQDGAIKETNRKLASNAEPTGFTSTLPAAVTYDTSKIYEDTQKVAPDNSLTLDVK